MKVGLFVCDHVSPENQGVFGDYPTMFEQLFPALDFKIYDVFNGQFPENFEECDAYMATGSHHSVYEDIDWIIQLKNTVRGLFHHQKYFVGFCFGHQILATALDGKVEKSPNGWSVGVHTFDVNDQQKWMKPFQEKVNLLMMCQDQVMALPEHAKLLAGNEQCPVGMFQLGPRMLGIQAHPEFSKSYDRLLMESRVDRMGESLVQKGIKSLEMEVHQQLIHDWVMQFLTRVI